MNCPICGTAMREDIEFIKEIWCPRRCYSSSRSATSLLITVLDQSLTLSSVAEWAAWSEVLRMVPGNRLGEFARLAATSECTDEFSEFFNSNADCRKAFDLLFHNDQFMMAIASAIMPPDQPG